MDEFNAGIYFETIEISPVSIPWIRARETGDGIRHDLNPLLAIL